MMKSKQYTKNGEGENYNYSQDHCFVKRSFSDTHGELCLIEDTLKLGFHLKRHHDKLMTEVFYMLIGEMELVFDDETITLRAGDTITVQPNEWHEAICKDSGKYLQYLKMDSLMFS